jgi:hypothetical protein
VSAGGGAAEVWFCGERAASGAADREAAARAAVSGRMHANSARNDRADAQLLKTVKDAYKSLCRSHCAETLLQVGGRAVAGAQRLRRHAFSLIDSHRSPSCKQLHVKFSHWFIERSGAEIVGGTLRCVRCHQFLPHASYLA